MMQALLISNLLLWVALIVLAIVVLALARQVGVLHERLAPAGAMLHRSGPEVGEPAPLLTVTTIGGASLQIGGPADDGRGTLVFFVSPTCPVCKTLLPTVIRIARSQSPPSRLVLASDGAPAEHEAFASGEAVQGLPYVLSADLGMSYEVAKLPYAVLIDAAGVLRAKGLVNTREHVESLFEAERLGLASIQDWQQQRSGDGDGTEARESAEGDGP